MAGAYQNFPAALWSKSVQRDLPTKSVFLEDCNRKYEGEVKGRGDRVKILGVGKPTITLQKPNSFTLDAPETVEDTSSMLIIDQMATFNYMVGDITKIQTQSDIASALREESSEGLSGAIDESIAALALDKLAVKAYSSAQTLTSDNVLTVFQTAMRKLLENDVSPNTQLIATIPPWVWIMWFGKLTDVDTNNSKRIKTVQLGNYGMITFKMTNRCATTSGTNHVMVRTNKAIAAAVPKIHTEAFRPEDDFADAVKGYALWGSKLVRPKEMVVLDVKQSA